MTKQDIKLILCGIGILILDIFILALFYFICIGLWLIIG